MEAAGEEPGPWNIIMRATCAPCSSERPWSENRARDRRERAAHHDARSAHRPHRLRAVATKLAPRPTRQGEVRARARARAHDPGRGGAEARRRGRSGTRRRVRRGRVPGIPARPAPASMPAPRGCAPIVVRRLFFKGHPARAHVSKNRFKSTRNRRRPFI